MKAKEVLETLQITRPTLAKYKKMGLVKVDSEINGQYIYNDESVYKLLSKTTNQKSGTAAEPALAAPAELKKMLTITDNLISILAQLGGMELLTEASILKLRAANKLLKELKETYNGN